jgi:protein TonB
MPELARDVRRRGAVIDHRLLICAGISILAHVALSEAVSLLPPLEKPVVTQNIEMRVISPPPPAEPPPQPAPEPEPPKPTPPPKPEPKVVHEKPAAKPVQATVHDTVAKDVPIATNAVTMSESSAPPVFGVTMESTSQGGSGPAVAVGNTTNPQAPTGPAPTKPAAVAVAAVEVTKMPLPQGRCSGKYTDEARTAGIEGVVVLDLVVDESGRARDIKVVSGLEHGLTEAAIAALKACQFSPGERGGEKVAVRVRGFKIRFVLADAQ